MNEQVIFIFLFVEFLIIGGLGLFVFKLSKRFKYFQSQPEVTDVKSILKSFGEENSKIQKLIVQLAKEVEIEKQKSANYMQRIGYVRFNPFNETGGDHSFSIAILNEKNTGLVLTGLHSRNMTRTYAKKIDAGGVKIRLSKEEEEAVKLAKIKNE